MSKAKELDFVPPRKSLTVEFYVGIFAIIGIVCFAYLAINLAGMRFSNAGYYEVIAEFDNISGLKMGASVEIAGVPVGVVEKIELEGIAARVILSIKDNVKLRSDDIAAIRTKGIIGDRYIKIMPGGDDNKLKSGDRLTDTESAVEFEEIIGKIIHRME